MKELSVLVEKKKWLKKLVARLGQDTVMVLVHHFEESGGSIDDCSVEEFIIFVKSVLGNDVGEAIKNIVKNP